MNTISKRIKDLREEKNLSQTKMAAEIAVKRHHVVDIEAEKQRPPYETIIKYAEYFGVNMDWLMTGEGEKYAKAGMVKETAASYGAGILESMAQKEADTNKKLDFLIDMVANLSQEVKELKAEKVKEAEPLPRNNQVPQKAVFHAPA